ncbi:MAG: hypothetical protein ACRD5K_09540 [Candidatus Acidiferrales bacterium]
MGWTLYSIVYSALFFGLGFRIQNKKGSVGSAIGLELIGIFAICFGVFRSLYYIQWLVIPLVVGTLLIEIILFRRGYKAHSA